jgi:hypothetical protein
MEFLFAPGSRVRLAPAAVAFYGGVWPHFVPQGQGGGTAGTILEAEDRPYKPGAAPRPYVVQWDNGVVNSYREEDLQRDDDGSTEGSGGFDEDPSEGPSNIVPFGRR